MRTINIEESRKIQMDILSFVDGFCHKKNLKYSLAFGSLLGAVRHKGFIPWDDDIDICMPREDYDKFVELFPKTETNYYKIGDMSCIDNWTLPFAKVYDSRTTLIHLQSNTCPMGVFIDVFPFDTASEDEKSFNKDKRERNRLKKLVVIKMCVLRKTNGIALCLKLAFLKVLFYLIPLKYILKLWQKSAKKRNKEVCNVIADNIFGLLKKPVPVSVFSNLSYYRFEDRTYVGFSDYDIVLKATYGDYWKLPPEEDRVPKHELIAYWK